MPTCIFIVTFKIPVPSIIEEAEQKGIPPRAVFRYSVAKTAKVAKTTPKCEQETKNEYGRRIFECRK